MNRRSAISLLGGAAVVWPMVARGQQQAMPVIGFLGAPTANAYASRVAAYREALKEAGFVEGQNVRIEYRWADDQIERLPSLADELVRLHSTIIIAAGGGQAALAARNATATVPIVFMHGSDPVKLGLVASLSRPGGNITGVTNLTVETQAKRFELICEMIPSATVIGWLFNPRNPNLDTTVKDIERASQALNRQVVFATVASEDDLDAAFDKLVQQHAGALAVSGDPLFASLRNRLIYLSARYAIPTMFPFREFVAGGGLASYGVNANDSFRQVAIYTARILKGEKPAELPVVQSTTYELVMNLKTARALRLEIPMSLLMRVNEVIE